MSDQNGQEIGVNVYDDEDELIEGEEAAAPQPVEVVREEILTVTRNTGTEDNDIEDDLRELVKSHSDQISRTCSAQQISRYSRVTTVSNRTIRRDKVKWPQN